LDPDVNKKHISQNCPTWLLLLSHQIEHKHGQKAKKMFMKVSKKF